MIVHDDDFSPSPETALQLAADGGRRVEKMALRSDLVWELPIIYDLLYFL